MRGLAGFSSLVLRSLLKQTIFKALNIMNGSINIDIDEETVHSRAEVKVFDKSQLKHVDTKEENPLPGAGGN